MFTCEAVQKAKPSDIEVLAEKLEPSLAKAIRELIRDHVRSVDLAKLEAALTEGQTWKVLDIIGEVDPVKAAAVREQLQNAVWAGGALAVQDPAFTEVRFAFQRLNPALVTWLESYSLNLIRDIGEGTRAAVRTALVEGMKAGKNPIDQARAIKQSVGLTETQAKSVANYRHELENFHKKRSAKGWGLGNQRSKISGVEVMRVDAKTGKPLDGIEQRRLRDQRYDAALKRAMETKTPLKPEQIDKMVERYQERLIQNRARTIARTESLRATNVGVAEAWRQAIDEGKFDGSRVRKRWVLAKDERTCAECQGIFKAQPKRGIPLDALFENPQGRGPLKLPPAHPSCRCGHFVRLYEPEQLQDAA